MSEPTHVTTDTDAAALAAYLTGGNRRMPAIVVTTASRRPYPYIDSHRIAAELSGLADVHLLASGPFTWSFSERMPRNTQVYGGAGRAYPVDLAWMTDPYLSPLRFAFDIIGAARAAELLIVDGLEMAADAGLMPAPPDASDAIGPDRQRMPIITDVGQSKLMLEPVRTFDEPDEAVGAEDPPRPTAPTPLLLDPTRRQHPLQNGIPHPGTERDTTDSEASDRKAITAMSNTIAALKAEVTARTDEVAALGAEVAARSDEVAALEDKVHRMGDRLAQAHQKSEQRKATIERRDAELKHLRKQLHRSGRTPEPAQARVPEFADPERGFRHAVEAAWASRVPVAEQPTRPLGHYRIGPDFLDSVDALEGISVDKIVDVVVEVVTGLAESLNGREIHPLRTCDGGGSPARKREDGAVAWRVSLQSNAPGARRLHFWRLPDGRVELSRVVLDDTDS